MQKADTTKQHNQRLQGWIKSLLKYNNAIVQQPG